MAKEKEAEAFDAKEMIAENAQKGTKVTFTDRVKVEMIKPTKNLKVGKVIAPHKVKAEALIKQGLAKKVKTDD